MTVTFSAIRSISSSVVVQNPNPTLRFHPNPDFKFRPNPNFIRLPSGKFRIFTSRTNHHNQQQQRAPSSDEHDVEPSPPLPISSSSVEDDKTTSKSLVVATGEVFLGLASILLRTRLRPDATASAAPLPVVEDRGVIWEQGQADERGKTGPGFSFSAAGLLFPYHLGVADFLLQNGYIKETTPLAGSSAGAIVCAVIASGSSMQDAFKITKVLADDCRLKGTAFRLGAVLREILHDFFPDDVHVRSSGRIRVAITQLLWRPRGLLVDKFDSRDDLINAVITSSFIPGYLAPRPATIYRNRLCIDGGLTLFMPPTSAPKTIQVCVFPMNQLGLKGIGISPDCNPQNRATARQLFNWALEPADDYILDKLYELGNLDAATWAEKNPIDTLMECS